MALSRRSFLTHSGRAAAAAVAAPWIRFSRASPNETLVVGLIGCRSMGFGDLTNHLKQSGVVCGGLCDVDADILDQRATEIVERTGTQPRRFRDYRRMLDDADFDAVIIGTPDHWHCLQMTDACSAGKDVYVEKPMANSIAELDAMVAAARRHSRVVQVGQQQRSGQHWQDVVDFVQSGQLGDVRQIKVWGFFEYGKGLPRVPNEPAPPHVDFDMWLGPAPDQPFNPHRFHSVWRHQWDFGGGLLTDWGVHLLDIVIWAMKIDEPPLSVSASGGIYTYGERAIETPDTLSVLYDMGDYTVTWEHLAGLGRGLYDRHYGIAFIGNNGTLVVNRSGWEVIAEELDGEPLMEPVPFVEGIGSNHESHAMNFIESIKSRKDPICTVEDGRRAALMAHLGNIAYRTGTPLAWDDSKERFVGSTEADAFIRPAYRAPWTFPTGA